MIADRLERQKQREADRRESNFGGPGPLEAAQNRQPSFFLSNQQQYQNAKYASLVAPSRAVERPVRPVLVR